MRKFGLVLVLFLSFFVLIGCDQQEALATDLSSLQAGQDALADEVADLIEANQDLLDVLGTLMNETDLMTEIDALKAQNTELLADIANMHDREELEAALEAVKTDNAALISQLEAELADSLMQEAELRAELDELKDDLSILMDNLDYILLVEDFKLQGYDYVDIPELIVDYYHSVLSFENEQDGMTVDSSISLAAPIDENYDKIDVEILYRGASKMKLTLYPTDELTFDFQAPYFGKYELKTTVTYDNKTYVDSFDLGVVADHYNFQHQNATMPVLLYTADLVASDRMYPSYARIERTNTYNWTKLPENVFTYPDFIANAGFFSTAPDKIGEWVGELYEMNPDSTFTMNVTDNYVGFALAAFDIPNLPEENYTINIWTDGTGSYYWFDLYYKQASSLTYWTDRLNTLRASIRDGSAGASINYTWSPFYAFALAQEENVNYYVTNKQGFVTTDPVLQAAIDANITQRTVSESFDTLIASGNINEFEYLLNTRWGEGEDEAMSYYFNSEKGKYLLILGTSTAGEVPTTTNKYYTFDEYVDIIITNYGAEYEIFYKGHPRYPSDETRIAMFEEKNILELVNTIPVEILMYIYPEVYVGGYVGSSFLSSAKDQTIFWFGDEAWARRNTAIANLIDTTDIFDNVDYLYDPTV